MLQVSTAFSQVETRYCFQTPINHAQVLDRVVIITGSEVHLQQHERFVGHNYECTYNILQLLKEMPDMHVHTTMDTMTETCND